MTDIEQRARDALNVVTAERSLIGGWQKYGREEHVSIEALCRQIEAHDATKAEFSEVATKLIDELAGFSEMSGRIARKHLSRFILPEPVDPLVEAMQMLGEEYPEKTAERLRGILAKRGLTIQEQQP